MVTTSTLPCPNCEAALSKAELKDGWCESCGKAIPHFVHTLSYARSTSQASVLQSHASRHEQVAQAITSNADSGPISARRVGLIGITLTVVLVVFFYGLTIGDPQVQNVLVTGVGLSVLGMLAWGISAIRRN